MGKTYSVEKKTEEVIIAQNGANNASNSHIEQTIEKYGWIVLVILAAIVIYYSYMIHQKCKKNIKKMLQKEMTVWHSSANLPVAQQQPQPRHINNIV